MAVQDSPACVANLILSLFSKIEKHYLAGDSTEIQGDWIVPPVCAARLLANQRDDRHFHFPTNQKLS